MKVGIVGLGYVGLPLAVGFAEGGAEVVGLDISANRVRDLSEHLSPIEDVSDERLRAIRDRARYTCSYQDLAACDAVLVCVPTPLSNKREPDLSYLLDVGAELSAVLRRGQLVVLESTTYPGTTRDRLAPVLEESGLKAGSDFHLAFSPERIDPGREDYTVDNTPKVVGGLTDRCAEIAEDVYRVVTSDVVRVSSPEAAELTKLLENIFRSVNIALVNELAQLCDRMSIDIWEVIDAASSKPFGFMRFEPGPGMGGHCLPVDPFYLAFRAREFDFYTEFIELSGKTNTAQPGWCVDKIAGALNDAGKSVRGARVCVVGVAYKGGVGDIRESPALRIIEKLQARGAEITYVDPHVPDLPSFGLTASESTADCDCACIVTAHPNVDHEEIVRESPLVVDFRGVVRHLSAPNVVSFGTRAATKVEAGSV